MFYEKNTSYFQVGFDENLHTVMMVDRCYMSESHVVSGPSIGQGSIDSARQNLAASFVSGLVNAAFCKDKLLTEDGNTWLYKNKEHGKYKFFARCTCFPVFHRRVPISCTFHSHLLYVVAFLSDGFSYSVENTVSLILGICISDSGAS